MLKVDQYNASGAHVQSINYAYDALDRRARQTVVFDNGTPNGVPTLDERYVYENGELATVYNLLAGGLTAGGKLRERYLNARAVDLVLAQETLSSANVVTDLMWYLHDHQGTPRDTLHRAPLDFDQDGVLEPGELGPQHWQHFRYDAFGELVAVDAVTSGAPTTAPRIGYTGQVFDVTIGLNYYHARYYDANLGRFLSQDPAGFSTGDLNLYRYVGNDPVSLIDPTGMNPFRPNQWSGMTSDIFAPLSSRSINVPASALYLGGPSASTSRIDSYGALGRTPLLPSASDAAAAASFYEGGLFDYDRIANAGYSSPRALPTSTSPQVPAARADEGWGSWFASGWNRVKNTVQWAGQAVAKAGADYATGFTEGFAPELLPDVRDGVDSNAGLLGQMLGSLNRGTAQGMLNIVNGVQDIAVGAWNLSVLTSPAGIASGGALMIESPDWSYGVLTSETTFLHNASKFIGGESVVTLATVGVGSLGRATLFADAATPARGLQSNTSASLLQRARRFLWDNREFSEISREYWATHGPADGRSLHHWLFSQADSLIPRGFRNAGANLLELPPMRGVFHPTLSANTWMGFAKNWGNSAAVDALLLEGSIKLGIPALSGGVGYSSYYVASQVIDALAPSETKK